MLEGVLLWLASGNALKNSTGAWVEGGMADAYVQPRGKKSLGKGRSNRGPQIETFELETMSITANRDEDTESGRGKSDAIYDE